MFRFLTRRGKKKKRNSRFGDGTKSLRFDDDDIGSSFSKNNFHSTPNLHMIGDQTSGLQLKSQSSSMLHFAGEYSSDMDAYNINRGLTDEDGDTIDSDSGRDTVNSSLDFQSVNEFSVRDECLLEMPPEQEVKRRFEDYLDVISSMSRNQLTERTLSVEEKWKVIFNQQIRSPIYTSDYYTDRLKPVGNTKEREKKLKEDGSYISTLLRKLKLDLKMSFDSFVEEFIKPPNEGIELLLGVLKFIQQSANSKTPTRGKQGNYKRTATDEYDCLLCIKLCLRIKGSLEILASTPDGVEIMSMCLLSSFTKTRVVTLEILTVLCALIEGYDKVMEAMTQIRLKYSEVVRFRFLLGMLNSSGAMNVKFQAACVGFFNKILQCTTNPNARVYLQHELEQAGFEPENYTKFSTGSEPEHEDLRTELEDWKHQYIDVQDLQDKLCRLDSKQHSMKQKVDDLVQEVEKLTRSKDTKIEKLEEGNNKLKKQVTELEERTQDGTKTIAALETKLADLKEQLGSQQRDQDLKEVINFLDSSISEHDTHAKSPSSVTPVPPPLPPPKTPEVRKRTDDPGKMSVKPSPMTRMPLLNWTPLTQAKDTIFEIPDSDSVYERLDFQEFEKTFKLKTRKESFASKQKRERVIKKQNEKLTYINPPRARNMVITKRRIGHTSRSLRDSIEQCDIQSLSGEYAELLVKFVPTTEELQWLQAHENEANKMGEAELFLLQLSRIDRLQQKLNTMVYMENFDDTVRFTEPLVNSVKRSSLSVLHSERLKRVCKIILAFGNFMNCTKRGFVVGFKLSTLRKLREVKSTDRNQTLLHYLADTLSTKYPDLHRFYDDFEIDVQRGASLEAVEHHISMLRKTMDTVAEEAKLHPQNTALNETSRRISSTAKDVVNTFEEMLKAYQGVCALFGEDYRQTEISTFFKTISDFVSDYKVADDENKARKNTPPVVLVNFRNSNSPQSRASTAETRAGSGSPRFRYSNNLSKDSGNFSSNFTNHVNIKDRVPSRGSYISITNNVNPVLTVQQHSNAGTNIMDQEYNTMDKTKSDTASPQKNILFDSKPETGRIQVFVMKDEDLNDDDYVSEL